MTEIEELSYDKCRELLAASIVGRVGFNAEDGPRIIPVNFTLVEDSVVFRTTPYSELGRNADDVAMAFEVDHVDYEDHKGWSVLAVGTSRLVEHIGELEDLGGFWNPRPWAGGNRMLYVQLHWSALTGRRLGGGWTRGERAARTPPHLRLKDRR